MITDQSGRSCGQPGYEACLSPAVLSFNGNLICLQVIVDINHGGFI